MEPTAAESDARFNTSAIPDESHAVSIERVYEACNADPAGISSQIADERLERDGPNRLPSAPPIRWWVIAARQFQSPLIYILGLAAGVSLAIGETTDAGFILGVLVINAAIGSVQEWRADRSTRALQKLLRIVATVVRNGESCEVNAEALVVGDIVWIESGDRVPADLRLTVTHGLEIDESLLTGESLAVTKHSDWIGEPKTAIADRRNMAFAGSTVIRGRAKGVVVSTGERTQVGRLAVDVMSIEPGKPPLLVRLERFARVVGIFVLLAAVAIGTVGVFLHGYSITDMFMFGIALAVSAIPEGLPVAITIALAVATTRMARRGVIVRRLGAVEGLGSCTLIASDKTGTLTCNELTVRHVWLPSGDAYDVTGEGYTPIGGIEREGKPIDPTELPELIDLARVGTLCNEADLHKHGDDWSWRGDPTEIALLSFGHKLGLVRDTLLESHPLVNEIPFEAEHRFAATYHAYDGTTLATVKGAPERILQMCDTESPETVERTRKAAENLARSGYRVLAAAQAQTEGVMAESDSPPAPEALRLLGLVCMIDPLRPATRDAIQTCHDAGIDVAMVTGDHPGTAASIGRTLGLVDDEADVLLGDQVEEFSDAELDEAIEGTRVFARVAPHHKLRIVEAAQRRGSFVAVTGDGVNDAPALKRANIGVAMGRTGTDVAREAADLVISDDNFATIVAGIEEGRVAYNNIRNVIFLLVSTGAAEVVLVALSVIGGYPLPLLPVQLLWLNLVTNGIQDVALAFEPALGNELRDPPRATQEPVFNRVMIRRTIISALVMGLVAFAVFVYLLEAGWSEPAARNVVLLLMVLFEIVHIGNCRSETVSAFRLSPLRAPILLVGTLSAFAIHLLTMHSAFGQHVLSVEPVDATVWAALFACALTVLVAMEIEKAMRRKNTQKAQPPNNITPG